MPKGSWITLESVILDYISESEQSNHKYFKLWQIAFRGMEELGIDFFYQIKTVQLSVASTKTAPLPPDYANYSKIGVLNNVGQIIPFTYNSNITLYSDVNPDRLSKIQSDNYGYVFEPNSLCFYNYWNGYDYGNMYGLPSAGYTGSFRIDDVNNVIVLDSEFNYSNIILEYVSFPKEGETYFIPAIFRQALLSWIAWRDIINMPAKRGVGTNIQMRERQFYNDRRLARGRFNPFHIREAYEFNLQAQRLTVKM